MTSRERLDRVVKRTCGRAIVSEYLGPYTGEVGSLLGTLLCAPISVAYDYEGYAQVLTGKRNYADWKKKLEERQEQADRKHADTLLRLWEVAGQYRKLCKEMSE